MDLQGIYMADVSSKSAQYCRSGMSGGTGLLMLCEVELGKPMYEIPTGDFNAEAEAKKRGFISTLGVGRTAPQGWMDGSSVHESLKGVIMVSSRYLGILLGTTTIDPLCSLMPRKVSVITSMPKRTDICNTTSKNLHSAEDSKGRMICLLITPSRYIAYNVAQIRIKYLFRVGM